MIYKQSELLHNVDIDPYLDMYDRFDPAHNRKHVELVRQHAALLARKYMEKEREKAELAAVLHDIGLVHGRDNHESAGGRMVRNDPRLRSALSELDLEDVALAVERHRSSSNAAETTLDKIVSDADRMGSENMFNRAFSYKMHHNPNMDEDEAMLEAANHVVTKFGPGGRGRRLFFPESEVEMDKRITPIIDAITLDDIGKLKEVLKYRYGVAR